MRAELSGGSIKASCPSCKGALTTYEDAFQGRDLGHLEHPRVAGSYLAPNGSHYSRMIYFLLRCAGCGRGGFAQVFCNSNLHDGTLGEFFPLAIDRLPLPSGIPSEVVAEFREAEDCMSIEAWRAASAMFRSALEKVLKANGYTEGKLPQKINQAGSDGILSATLVKRANDNVRVLGNEILHDPWREIEPDEVEDSRKYCQRVLEAFYDHRPTVEAQLKAANRLHTS